MVGYSAAAGETGPYSYTLLGTFDANLRVVRVAPTRTMDEALNAASQPSFTVRFRARVH